jgi:hypothetical protein
VLSDRYATMACQLLQPENANIFSMKINASRNFAELVDVGYFSVGSNWLHTL